MVGSERMMTLRAMFSESLKEPLLSRDVRFTVEDRRMPWFVLDAVSELEDPGDSYHLFQD